MQTDRRHFLALAATAAVGATLPGSGPRASGPAPVQTSAAIIIIGAGAAGTALANRLVGRLTGAKITP
ncbi:MAG: twin-arginine translocation signal domain-containing protein [Burkholderiaceae bacterium]